MKDSMTYDPSVKVLAAENLTEKGIRWQLS